MDDDGGDWFTGGDDEPAPEAPAATPAAAESATADAAPAGGDLPAIDVPAGDKKEDEEDQYLDPDKLLIFRHWIRPKFLQYKYLYDYRHNYYDDVIDYLDKRQRGLHRDVPRAQTWAERALRTYSSKLNTIHTFEQQLEDTKLVTKMRLSGTFQRYHSKEYINRRYSSILF